MKMRHALVVFGFLALFAGLITLNRSRSESRRIALIALQRLDSALGAHDTASILDAVKIPAALRDRTFTEQAEFISKALRDELSPEGLAVLRREGEFGALRELFPQEAEAWASQANVRAEDCVAFKAERNRLRVEVVLAKPSPLAPQLAAGGTLYRIVRCNNVKQLAAVASAN